MKAIFQTGYGSPDFFELKEVNEPDPKDNEVLVRVHAASLHAGDIFFMRGVPYMVRLDAGFPQPKNHIPGFDVSGTVEMVGKNVTRFKPADEVMGAYKNTCADFLCVPVERLVPKPANLTLEQAAAVPTSALSALQGLRDKGQVLPGQKVLINGATGGVGHYAIQIAKALGAEVTGVCSTGKMDLVKSLGADHVIDYTNEDFTMGDKRYDLILDQVANHSLSAFRRVLTPKGIYLPNSGHSGLAFIAKAFFLSLFLRKQGRPYISIPNQKDLMALKNFVESGKVKPVIDRIYPMSKISKAFGYLDEGHASGKVVIIAEGR
jgi:NADPH:quinone reductase-like Zn-dependent oxidoreductase